MDIQFWRNFWDFSKKMKNNKVSTVRQLSAENMSGCNPHFHIHRIIHSKYFSDQFQFPHNCFDLLPTMILIKYTKKILPAHCAINTDQRVLSIFCAIISIYCIELLIRKKTTLKSKNTRQNNPTEYILAEWCCPDTKRQDNATTSKVTDIHINILILEINAVHLKWITVATIKVLTFFLFS